MTETTTTAGRAQLDDLVGDWVDLWNGDYDRAEKIVAPEVRVHAALMDGGDGSAVDGPVGVVALIRQIRAVFADLRFEIQVGPIVDGDHIALRWVATGAYAGGFPGAGAPSGTGVTFTGTDTLRIENGRIVEYWLNADTLLLVTQLQVRG